MQLGGKLFLVLAFVPVLAGCLPDPQTHPLKTAPIPDKVQFLEECSMRGTIMCSLVSFLSKETAVERRSACVAYIEPSGRRVEQCGSIPASQP
jgi:hypothetical protein